MKYVDILTSLLKSFSSINNMFDRINYNLDFKSHCEKLKCLQDKLSISFITPTRNEASHLPMNLMSIKYVAKVCNVPVETIVVDYESTDGTPDIARKIGAKVISVEKPGVGYASYIGVLNASGDIVIRTDADVIMTPSAIFEIQKIFNEKSKVLVATVGHIYYPINFVENWVAYAYDAYIRKPYNTTGYFIAFRKEIADKVNFDPKLRANDDWDFGMRAYKTFGIGRLYYNHYIAVLVSSRYIKKKGLLRYVCENTGIIKVVPVPYTQLAMS